MKTKGNDLLKQLDPDVRDKFMKNLKANKGRGATNYLEDTYFGMNKFIDCAFTWADTPEGHEYWRSLAHRKFSDYKTKPYDGE